MSFNLVETAQHFMESDVISRATSQLGENPNQLQKALSATVPSVLTAILAKVAHGNSSLTSVFNMAKESESLNISGNIGSLLNQSANTSTPTTNIFGDKLGNVTSAIANYAGIKQSSASSLINIATPAALSIIGRYASNNSLSANGLLAMLVSQKDKILSMIPAGLPLAKSMGLTSMDDISNKLSGSLSTVSGEVKQRMRYVPALLLGLLAVIILWVLFSRKSEPAKTEASQIATNPQASTTTATTANTVATPVSIKVQLPNGITLEAYKGGIEDRLVAFLNDANSKPGKDTWFDFDNLNFETGSAKITAASQVQVNNIAAILKAYPKLKIKIGGYTDKTGDDASNKKLSQQRADAVVTALKAAGSNASQLTGAEGYGSEFAKMPATASEEERKIDRRIAVSVREK